MATQLEVVQGQQIQSSNEQIIWAVNVANWTATPSSPVINKAEDLITLQDVKTTVIPGSPSVLGTTITLPILKALTGGHSYRILIGFQDGAGNQFEATLYIQCPY